MNFSKLTILLTTVVLISALQHRSAMRIKRQSIIAINNHQSNPPNLTNRQFLDKLNLPELEKFIKTYILPFLPQPLQSTLNAILDLIAKFVKSNKSSSLQSLLIEKLKKNNLTQYVTNVVAATNTTNDTANDNRTLIDFNAMLNDPIALGVVQKFTLENLVKPLVNLMVPNEAYASLLKYEHGHNSKDDDGQNSDRHRHKGNNSNGGNGKHEGGGNKKGRGENSSEERGNNSGGKKHKNKDEDQGGSENGNHNKKGHNNKKDEEGKGGGGGRRGGGNDSGERRHNNNNNGGNNNHKRGDDDRKGGNGGGDSGGGKHHKKGGNHGKDDDCDDKEGSSSKVRSNNEIGNIEEDRVGDDGEMVEISDPIEIDGVQVQAEDEINLFKKKKNKKKKEKIVKSNNSPEILEEEFRQGENF